MPENVTVSELKKISENILNFWQPYGLEEILKTYQPENVRGLAAHDFHRAQAHPFAVTWHDLQREITKSEEANSFRLSPNSLFLLSTLCDLMEVDDSSEVNSLMKHIMVKNQFYSGLFEVDIFTAYKNENVNIKVIPEQSSNSKSPDFEIRHSDEIIFLECKSLEDKSKSEEDLWNQIENSILKFLYNNKLSKKVTIKALKPLEGKDVTTVTKFTQESLLRGISDSFPIGNSFIITIETIAKYGMTYPGSFTFERGFRGRVECENYTDIFGINYYKNPNIIESQPFNTLDETRSILNAIDSARKQLKGDFPNIIHVEIPYRNGEKFFEITDKSFQKIFNKIKGSKRINAVVLSGRVLNQNVQEGQNPILFFNRIIPNPNAAKLLPNDFVIHGAKSEFGNKLMDTGEGAILVELDITSLPEENIGKSIYFVGDAHGKQQVRLWQSFKGLLRADIVDYRYGLKTFVTDYYLNIGKHKIVVTWSDLDVRMAANGKLLSNIYLH